MILQGDGFYFDFTDAIDGLQFDQQDNVLPNYHDIEDMPRVDFIVELQEDILFIEVKDPGNPRNSAFNQTKFQKKLNDGTLMKSLADKYRYTFFFRWAERQLPKTVHFLNLITLQAPLLENLNDELRAELSMLHKNNSVRWQAHPLRTCMIFNLDTWNSEFPKWPVRRI